MNPLDLKDDIVVFDMDGVLNRYNFPELGFKIYSEEGWIRKNMEIDVYSFAEKTSLFDELIESKNSMDLYICSAAGTSFEQTNKIRFLEEKYPNFREDNIIFVGKTEFKIEVLKYLRDLYDSHGKQDKRIVIIEDTVSVLDAVEKLNNPMIKCYLVSDFI